MHILVVDDSTDLLDMLSIVYSRRNFLISGVRSREELFLGLERMIPDLILLDVVLDNSDGRAICKELKSNEAFRNIPVILMSADPEQLQQHQEIFADDIMEKPFSTETILMKVKALLRKIPNSS